ncbi:MAG: hypothetical protein M1833_007099 [Piccolia ochrophora]|nr:MAG: hypothetical protein M1833_007099 [Piccolia ochrophora]
MTLPTSSNHKTPARSFFHRSYHDSQGPKESDQSSALRVREQTAELASYALSDAASSTRSDSPPSRPYASSFSVPPTGWDLHSNWLASDSEATPRAFDPLSLPDVIQETSEPVTPAQSPSLRQASPPRSALSQMLRQSLPGGTEDSTGGSGQTIDVPPERQQAFRRTPVVEEGRSSSQSPNHEQTPLLPKFDARRLSHHQEHSQPDVEGQYYNRRKPWNKSWDAYTIWSLAVVRPASFVPSVILGLLLNILDALSYGMILFPLGQPIFADLGPDGISMFYVSCIIAQLVYSCGGSIFKGGIGSEMIEVVPFFHKMAFTILAQMGDDDPKAVRATTILAFSLSSILTGLVFFGMGACRLGALIGFFPRHILIGCIGGVGWFLVATGLEVSARLDGNLSYNLATLKVLVQFDTVFLWMAPLLLAILLMICQHWVKHALFVPCYFLLIPAIFYFFVAVIPRLNLNDLRRLGWVFDMPPAGEPFYHFYTLYDFKAVDWAALGKSVPAMFALTFFGILHVPINVPALGFSTGEDNVNVDRELIAHGISNALSGLAGSIQNYLVYTNSLLFIRSGGDNRVAGVMLAFGTFGIMAIGPTLIGYIPIMVVGALIFLLGLDLLREALFDTWGRLHRLEYLTVIAIVVTMGAWDFVLGIVVGILLACLNFVVQTSRKSAIRATYTGEIAGSTVRRHPLQYRFLREVGQQIHVAKLSGFLFFGTIVSVENKVRALLEHDAFTTRPIRFLVVDITLVSGIDFSAAEAFTRINRILAARNVNLVLCGASKSSEIGASLQSVGLWDEGSHVEMFPELNSALEYCENELLRALYSRRDALENPHNEPEYLDVPKSKFPTFSHDTTFNSPREHHVQQAAQTTLTEENGVPPKKWQNFKQPLPLILQMFHELTTENEDFWFPACSFFVREDYTAGTVLYERGDRPNGFYLLEEGILKAEYDLPQGKYFESIVAGTTCGELPFFSETNRTATVSAERDSVTWLLDEHRWGELQEQQPRVARELLRISLKLTSERMQSITS